MTPHRIVLYIDTMHRGGAQRVMANIANYLIEKGWQVILVNDFEPDPNIMQYPVSQRIQRVYLRKELQGNKIIKNIERLVSFRKLVKHERPDIILSFLGRPNKRMLLSTIGLSCKKVVSVRNDPNKEYGTSVLKRLTANVIFRFADGCVFQTEEAKSYFSKAIQKKSKIILNPVDDKFFNVERSHNACDIVSIGRLEPQKNHELLIKAFSDIVQQGFKGRLIICGEGTLREKLEELTNNMGIQDRVILTGNIMNVEKVLSEAKVFVLSSDYEGLPNSLMEAMAAGVPCVSTDCPCGGPKFLIDDGTDGILIQCGNRRQLKEAIVETLRSKNAEEFGIRARHKAEMFRSSVILSSWETFLLFRVCSTNQKHNKFNV